MKTHDKRGTKRTGENEVKVEEKVEKRGRKEKQMDRGRGRKEI
jgi:hypothetical protein